MKKYIKNPLCEFIDDESESVIIFDQDMTVIHNVDKIGNIIIHCFDEATELDLLENKLSDVFADINKDELNEFVEWMLKNKIIIPLT